MAVCPSKDGLYDDAYDVVKGIQNDHHSAAVPDGTNFAADHNLAVDPGMSVSRRQWSLYP